MKAITLYQPWASVVAAGYKRIENRTRKLPAKMFGELVAIHAGLTYDPEGERTIVNTLSSAELMEVKGPMREVSGAVVGICRFTGYVEKGQIIPDPALADRFFFGPFGWIVEDAGLLPVPLPCKGALGFWELPAEIDGAIKALVSHDERYAGRGRS